MRRTFNDPAEFMDWLATQSEKVQIAAAKLTLALAALGIRGDVAAHMAYDAVMLAQDMAAQFDASVTKH